MTPAQPPRGIDGAEPRAHRISVYEGVGYTSALLMAAAVALGWFDIMIPWGS